MRRHDRGFWLRLGGYAVAGILFTAIGTTGEQGLIGGLVVGPLFIGWSIYEATKRLRHGPQPVGKHERTDVPN